VQRHGKALRKALLVGASRKSRHGMRHEKITYQNAALSECHEKVVMDSVMESNTCTTSWKGVMKINICLASRKRCHGKHQETPRRAASWKDVMESDTGGASRKSRHGMHHGKHDPSTAASRKKRRGKRRGRCDVMIVNSLVWCEKNK